MKVRVNKRWFDLWNDNEYIYVGDVGTVIEVCEDNIYGVAFDNYINGHTCGGKCSDNYGWYIAKDCVDIIHDDYIVPNTLNDTLVELIEIYKEEINDYYDEFAHGDSSARQYAYKRVVEDLEKLLKSF